MVVLSTWSIPSLHYQWMFPPLLSLRTWQLLLVPLPLLVSLILLILLNPSQFLFQTTRLSRQLETYCPVSVMRLSWISSRESIVPPRHSCRCWANISIVITSSDLWNSQVAWATTKSWQHYKVVNWQFTPRMIGYMSMGLRLSLPMSSPATELFMLLTGKTLYIT